MDPNDVVAHEWHKTLATNVVRDAVILYPYVQKFDPIGVAHICGRFQMWGLSWETDHLVAKLKTIAHAVDLLSRFRQSELTEAQLLEPMRKAPAPGDVNWFENEATRTLYAAATADMKRYAFQIGNMPLEMGFDEMPKYEIAVAATYRTVHDARADLTKAAEEELNIRLPQFLWLWYCERLWMILVYWWYNFSNKYDPFILRFMFWTSSNLHYSD